MRQSGQIAVLRFPHADLTPGKPRPVLLLAPVPGPYEDWLIAMISTQLQHAVEGFDEILEPTEKATSRFLGLNLPVLYASDD